jgi:lipopolysaccharide export system protein LptA
VDKKKDLVYFVGDMDLKQKAKMISGHFGVYDKKNQSILVKGAPKYREGRDFATAEKMILNTDNNEISMIGNFKGSFRSQKDKNKEQDTKKAQEIEDKIKEDISSSSASQSQSSMQDDSSSSSSLATQETEPQTKKVEEKPKP